MDETTEFFKEGLSKIITHELFVTADEKTNHSPQNNFSV